MACVSVVITCTARVTKEEASFRVLLKLSMALKQKEKMDNKAKLFTTCSKTRTVSAASNQSSLCIESWTLKTSLTDNKIIPARTAQLIYGQPYWKSQDMQQQLLAPVTASDRTSGKFLAFNNKEITIKGFCLRVWRVSCKFSVDHNLTTTVLFTV